MTATKRTQLHHSESMTDIPAEFTCPITMNIMSQPLCNRAGFNFDREAILSWLEKNGTCPLTRQPMAPSQLIPNHGLEMRINRFCMEHGIERETPSSDTENDDSDDDSEMDFRFVGFLSVTEKKHDEIMQRYGGVDNSLVAIMSAGGRHTSNNTEGTNSSSRNRRRFGLFGRHRR